MTVKDTQKRMGDIRNLIPSPLFDIQDDDEEYIYEEIDSLRKDIIKAIANGVDSPKKIAQCFIIELQKIHDILHNKRMEYINKLIKKVAKDKEKK